jgi:D-alanyl-D-alanine carboxypeptidase
MVPADDSGYGAHVMARLRLAVAFGFTILLLVPVTTARAADPVVPPVLPASIHRCLVPGPSSSTLTPERVSALQRRVERWQTRRHLPALSVAIIFPDGTTWTGSSGYADLATRTPVGDDTAFAIASVSKTFTSALILALRDEGRIDLEAPVITYLPELALNRRITVHQLLDHTSGLADFFIGPKIDKALMGDRAKAWSSAMAMGYVGKRYFAPGRGWHYSNTNYLLLGLIAERVSGESLAVQLRTRFFDRLGLEDTFEQIGETPRTPMAHGYRLRTANDKNPKDLSDGSAIVPFTSVITAAGAAGSIASTPLDLARWARALYTGGAITPASVASMIGDTYVTATAHATIPYGLGVQALTIAGHRSLGHSGRLLGFRSAVRWLPDEQVAIAVLTNQSRVDPGPILRSMLLLALKPITDCEGRPAVD